LFVHQGASQLRADARWTQADVSYDERIERRWSQRVVGADGRWVLLPDYPLPAGWNRSATDVVFPAA
jgi:hypothetical protein